MSLPTTTIPSSLVAWSGESAGTWGFTCVDAESDPQEYPGKSCDGLVLSAPLTRVNIKLEVLFNVSEAAELPLLTFDAASP